MAKKTRGALLKAARIFDVPGEPAVGVPRVTVTGTDRVHVENHRGLLDYGPETITVNASGTMIKLTGSGLEITAMTDLELVVAGRVTKVEYIL